MADDPKMVANLAEVEFEGQVWRMWSGVGDLEFEDNIYTGTNWLIEIGDSETDSSGPSGRLVVSFNAALTAQTRNVLHQDYGPLPISIEWIYSNDHGVSWRRIRRKRFGFMSNPSIVDGVFSFEIETYSGDRLRRQGTYVSDETHQAEFPGDTAFSRCREYSEGVEVPWPV